jgi:hypothetical protein
VETNRNTEENTHSFLKQQAIVADGSKDGNDRQEAKANFG